MALKDGLSTPDQRCSDSLAVRLLATEGKTARQRKRENDSYFEDSWEDSLELVNEIREKVGVEKIDDFPVAFKGDALCCTLALAMDSKARVGLDGIQFINKRWREAAEACGVDSDTCPPAWSITIRTFDDESSLDGGYAVEDHDMPKEWWNTLNEFCVLTPDRMYEKKD